MIPSFLADRGNLVCDRAFRMRELLNTVTTAKDLNRFSCSGPVSRIENSVSSVDVANVEDTKESEPLKINMFSEVNNYPLRNCSDEYQAAIRDLNSLQSNTRTIALAKYKKPEEILPLFRKQLDIAGVDLRCIDALNIIHVSGTKGKGSTCAFTDSILRSAGLKTGFYNSPHLIKVTERIRINGKPIEDRKFSSYFRYIYEKLLIGVSRENITMPSYFSFLTILAFHIFIAEKVDCAIIEVGIGGEYDPTNVIEKPVACGITSIHFDHTSILGNSIESIAWSKAGIAKKGVPVFTIEQEQPSAIDVILSRSIEKNCELYLCSPLCDDNNLQLGIKGPAQRKNAALACQLARHLLLTIYPEKYEKLSKPLVNKKKLVTECQNLPKFFSEGLTNCSWDGRCQIVKFKHATFFLDGAHTTESMENCLEWFLTACSSNNPKASKVLMVNVIGERSKKDVLRPLSESDIFDMVIFSSNKIELDEDKFQADKSIENVNNNCKTWKSLLEERGRDSSKTIVMPNTKASIKYVTSLSKQNVDKEYFVLVTGSLHFVGAILDTLYSIDNDLN